MSHLSGLFKNVNMVNLKLINVNLRTAVQVWICPAALMAELLFKGCVIEKSTPQPGG